MKIGIITMHRVLNFGSALQAFALQQAIANLGGESEIIDYIYPRPEKKHFSLKCIVNSALVILRNALIGFPSVRKKSRFKKFYNESFVLSAKSYTPDQIKKDPPLYDVYMTGSDQVWNPKYIGVETDFMLGFAPQCSKRLSYASSFATDRIPDELVGIYRSSLSKYDIISVRESYGCDIVKRITGRDAISTCDPTLLLTKEQWALLADKSVHKENEPYILVYILYYMYNPYPEIDRIVKNVQDNLGLKVIYLNGRMADFSKPNSKLNKDSGPYEFLRLVQNAKFVITTSFHGVAFSSIFGIPFLGIVKNRNKEGDRISSIINQLGCQASLVAYNDVPNINYADLSIYRCKEERIAEYRNTSLQILEKMINYD